MACFEKLYYNLKKKKKTLELLFLLSSSQSVEPTTYEFYGQFILY